MKSWTVSEIVEATDGVLWNQDGQFATVTAVSTDSRKIEKGCLFIPLLGEKFDGHEYIDQALQNGAAGVLCSKLPIDLQDEKFYIKVADTRLALKALATAYRKQFDIPFVQITGSVGKTTTKDMISSVIATHYRVLKTPENFNNDIGVPHTLFGLKPETEVAVIETGTNHFGEIRYLSEMIYANIGVITNIGDAHIEYLENREGILKEKSDLFSFLKPGGTAILNGDDALLDTLELSCDVIRCGKSEGCQVQVSDIVDHGVDGITCTVTTAQEVYELNIPAPGEHMVYPASMAVAIGEKLGITKDNIIRGVALYEPADSRMHVIKLPNSRTILDDCYNANPQSVTVALEILAKTECAHKIAVLGDMGELGELTDRAHYNVGTLVAMLGIDQLFAIGDKAAKIAEGAEQNGGTVAYYHTKEEALSAIENAFTEDTAVLIKASHSCQFGWLVDQLSK